MADNPPGHWLTISEAAHYFRISERTLRRRIAAGQLPTQKEGGRVLVMVYDSPADKGGQADTAPAVSAKLAELEAEVRRLSDLLSQVEGERDYLRQALAAAMSKIPAIEAGAESKPDPERRPWWKFWK